jgi:hypothetical protein
MDPVTIEDRKKELRVLLDKVRAAPSQELSRDRQRIIVLQGMLGAVHPRRETA